MRPLWLLVDAPCWAACPTRPAAEPGPPARPTSSTPTTSPPSSPRWPSATRRRSGSRSGTSSTTSASGSAACNPNAYAYLLGPAADAIHAADPEMPVVAGRALAPFEQAAGRPATLAGLRARRSINAGVADERIDAFAFHPYPPANARHDVHASGRAGAGRVRGLRRREERRRRAGLGDRGRGHHGRAEARHAGGAGGRAGRGSSERLDGEGIPVIVVHRFFDDEVDARRSRSRPASASSPPTASPGSPPSARSPRSRGEPCD